MGAMRKVGDLIALITVTAMLAPSPSIAEPANLKKRSADLVSKSAELNTRVTALINEISRQRFDELEEARADVRKELDAWMSGDAKMRGQKVQRVLSEAYRIAEEYGTDVARMKRVYGVARRAILRANFFSQGDTGIGTKREFTRKIRDAVIVGNVVHFYGLVDSEEERIARSMKKRLVQYRNLLQVYIKALTIQDPAQAMIHLRKYTDLVRGYVTEQERQAIEADTKMMLAHQNGVVEYVGAFPLVGTAMDVVMFYQGEDLAGNMVDRAEMAAGHVILSSVALGSLVKLSGLVLKATAKVTKAAAKRMPDTFARLGVLGTNLAQLKGPARKTLNKQLAVALGDRAAGEGDIVGALANKIIGKMLPIVAAKTKVLLSKIDGARKALDDLGDIGKRSDLFKLGRRQGKGLVADYQNIIETGTSQEIRDAMLAIQANKHAMQVLKDGSQKTIHKFNMGISGLYKEADELTKDALVSKYLDGFAKHLEKDLSKMSPADLLALKAELRKKIKIDLITNPSTGKVKPSFDRDITAKIEVAPGVWKDVPSKLLDEAYGPAFFKAAKGADLPSGEAGRAAAKNLMEEMDQVATDALHTEAYGAGSHDFRVALEKNKRSVFKDPEQIGLVYAYKGNHWFDKARKAIARAKSADPNKAKNLLIEAESHFEEGMRNLSKQFDKQIEERVAGFNKRLASQGRSPIRIPDDLRRANEIMHAVGKTEDPATAMKKLAELGMGPRDAAERMGNFVTKIHRTMSKGKQVVEKGKPPGGPLLLHRPSDWVALAPTGVAK